MVVALRTSTMTNVLVFRRTAFDACGKVARPTGRLLLACMVKPNVITPAHHLKIGEVIVGRIAVDVMHHFIRAQRATKVFFHDLTMEARLVVRSKVDADVPVLFLPFTAAPQRAICAGLGFCSARIAAVFAAPLFQRRGPSVERGAARLTDAGSLLWGGFAMMRTHRSLSLLCRAGTVASGARFLHAFPTIVSRKPHADAEIVLLSRANADLIEARKRIKELEAA